MSTATRTRDALLAMARVVIVSGSSLHLSDSSHFAESITSPTDIRPLMSVLTKATRTSIASKEREREGEGREGWGCCGNGVILKVGPREIQ